MGFRFSAPAFVRGETSELVAMAGTQLRPLFDQYRQALNAITRCPKAYSQVLLADAVLADLKLLQQMKPQLTNEYIMQQAEAWVAALALPTKSLNSLHVSRSGRIRFVRRSCCLVYRTEQGQLCSDCPRLHRRSNDA